MDEQTTERRGRIGFGFSGSGSEYFKIWIINILLTIVTLGIYSAWAKVRRKRYFYGCTSLDGSAFEYHADPKKILKGRLMVYGLYILFGLLGKVMPFLSLFLGVAFTAVLPYFIERSLRFNAVNSSYRNVRFGYDMKYGESFVVFVVFGFLSLISLGLLFPYFMFRMKKHIIENSRYGLQHFRFNGKVSDFYKIYTIPAVAAVAGALIYMSMSGFLYVLTPVFVVLCFLAAFAYVIVAQANYVINCLMLRENSFASDMNPPKYVWIAVTNYILTALTLGLFSPFASVRAARYRIDSVSLYAFGDINSFVAEEFSGVSAAGEELTDMLDMDFGL